MLELVRWAADEYHHCLLASPLAEAARRYVAERGLTDETVRAFGLGYAPLAGDWLAGRASQKGLSADTLEKVGLLGRRQEGNGFYDRFRDRLLFPIRNARGQAVGFGGRILPSSPLSARGPKYYNSSDTPLFTKSEQLYGLDQARQAGADAGYLAIVEGYTDVLMAHQMGVAHVVATMGTALNARHVQQLRRFRVPRVVLVFDADAGGATGVDRALEVFVSEDVDLAVATLPTGLDPCDLLLQQGPEAFRAVLESAVDVLEFKLNQVWAAEASKGIEGRRRAVDAVLGVLALAPEMPGQAGAVKRELMIGRIAQRLALKEATVWARLRELQATVRRGDKEARPDDTGNGEEARRARAAPHERDLLQVLLAEPALVPVAAVEVTPEQIAHPGLRRLLEGLYTLEAAGEVPDLDRLRERIDNPSLVDAALRLQEMGRMNPDRPEWLQKVLAIFRQRRLESVTEELQNQLHAASDHTEAVELLRQLQNQTVGLEPGAPTMGGTGP
jgi:DNA primase